jgi:hypothetical protein
MPNKTQTACLKCGSACDKSPCSKCKPAHQQTLAEKNRARNQDPDNAIYHKMEWINFSRLLRGRNPVCQRIGRDGKQCRYPCQLVHHLLSPRKHPSLFLSPSNCVAICKMCHIDGEGENPSKINRYVPTLWNDEVFPHIDSFGQPYLPSPVATGIDNWLRSMQSSSKPL